MKDPMQSLWIVIGIDVTVILLMEVVMWSLFSKRASPLWLAHELDTSSFGLWTKGRLAFFVLVHTVTLLFLTVWFLLAIW